MHADTCCRCGTSLAVKRQEIGFIYLHVHFKLSNIIGSDSSQCEASRAKRNSPAKSFSVWLVSQTWGCLRAECF